jgi:DNA-binding NarL/FixJ family response regulator
MATPRQPKKTSRSKAATRKKTFHGKRVVIVDDHPLIRRGLERMIHTTDRFGVCGEAGNSADAMAVIKKEKPDLAIVDVGLPDEDGISLTRKLRKAFPRLTILILSMHEDPSYATNALRAGAHGYMVKQDAVETIHVALSSVLAGRRYLSPTMAKQMPHNSSPVEAERKWRAELPRRRVCQSRSDRSRRSSTLHRASDPPRDIC